MASTLGGSLDGGFRVMDEVPWPVAANTFAAVVRSPDGEGVVVFQHTGTGIRILGRWIPTFSQRDLMGRWLGDLTLTPTTDCLTADEPLLAATWFYAQLGGTTSMNQVFFRVYPDGGMSAVLNEEIAVEYSDHLPKQRELIIRRDGGVPVADLIGDDGVVGSLGWNGSVFVPE